MCRIKIRSIVFFFIVCVFTTSCAYRFTNKHIRIPNNGRTIAIAPVYNTSRIVLPHDLLWDALQKAFAGNGNLLLSSQKNADFYLQTHIRDGRTLEFETDSSSTLVTQEILSDLGPNPLAPSAYIDLHSADIYSKRESLAFQVIVEVWDLRNKNLLLKKTYPMNSQFNMLTVQTTEESRYIRNEENFELLFAGQSKALAQQIVSDLFNLSYFDSGY